MDFIGTRVNTLFKKSHTFYYKVIKNSIQLKRYSLVTHIKLLSSTEPPQQDSALVQNVCSNGVWLPVSRRTWCRLMQLIQATFICCFAFLHFFAFCYLTLLCLLLLSGEKRDAKSIKTGVPDIPNEKKKCFCYRQILKLLKFVQ